MLKRIYAFLLAAVWALALAGCALGTGPVQSPAETAFLPSATQTVPPETHAPAPETDAPPSETPPEDTPATAPPATEAPALDADGFYHTKDEVALYLHLYGRLPDNYVTKREAQELGWTGGGPPTGASRFGNYEGLLPEKEGRTYQECDIDTVGKSSRGAKRIVFSNDGLIYYTGDHYESFELLYGEP